MIVSSWAAWSSMIVWRRVVVGSCDEVLCVDELRTQNWCRGGLELGGRARLEKEGMARLVC